jgi:glycosyltransferase involved in cell wall biosynthesis
MDIALVCTEMLPVPPIRGGAIQTYISGVAPILCRRHKLTIFSKSDPLLDDMAEVGGITYFRFPAPSQTTYYQAVREALSLSRFDLIQIFNRPAQLLLLKQVCPGARFTLSLHNQMLAPNRIEPGLASQTLQETSAVITVSHFLRKDLVRHYPWAEPKCYAVYSGCDLVRFRPIWLSDISREREQWRLSHGLVGKKVILFAGRLSRTKGPDVLVRAMPEVLESHPDSVLLITGSKWFSDETPSNFVTHLRELAQPLGNAVKFTGFVPPEEMHRVFQAADVFVCPSQWQEPLARVHYEAMATGLPIITTDRGGNAEVIHHERNGLVIRDFSDPGAFAKAIIRVLSSPELAHQLGARTRRDAEEYFGWDRVARDLEEVYSRVVA